MGVVSHGPLMLRIQREEDGHLVCLYGELDMSTADVLDRELERLESGPEGRVVLDLSGLDFLDSSGLRSLLRAHSRAQAGGHRLTLLRGRPEVQRVFEVTSTDALLPFED